MNGPIDQIPPNIFDLINKQMIYDAALKTKGSTGPSGMDTELYRRILCSKNFASERKLLRDEIAVMTRNLQKSCYHPSLLEAYTSCRLIQLDKNPGIRSIGVGEVLRCIIGKTTALFLKEEIKPAAGPLQVCADHSAARHLISHDSLQENSTIEIFKNVGESQLWSAILAHEVWSVIRSTSHCFCDRPF